ncbi:hypothetical protein XU18_5155 [Perkinsela sp. CCAP 1560/4]|nr:hypothetical protein XU18_5155 [Perkinsela sp. CCAP 1560/4]|eukprot:KNH01787.1 hypothetical protein XU18_5155 [Perkinsela sp. CCAP 1560/4]
MEIVEKEVSILINSEVKSAFVEARQSRSMSRRISDMQFELEKKLLFYLQMNSCDAMGSQKMSEYVAAVESVVSPYFTLFDKSEILNLIHIRPDSPAKVRLCFPTRAELLENGEALESVANVSRSFFPSPEKDRAAEYYKAVALRWRNKPKDPTGADRSMSWDTHPSSRREKGKNVDGYQPSFEYDHPEEQKVEIEDVEVCDSE